MVDYLEIPRFVDSFFYYTIELLWLSQSMSSFLSSDRENQIVITIGTLSHHIHVEF